MEPGCADPLASWEPCAASATLMRCARVSSTQDVARRLVQSPVPNIIGVMAAFQTAGRGRFGRAWVAPPGTCLLVTYIVPIPQEDFRPHPMLPLAAGLCVALAIEELTGLSAGLKWPNDVLLSGRKVAGVLVEAVNGRHGRSASLIGIGVNVNVSRFPGGLDEQATSLLRETGQTWDVDALERMLRGHLNREVRQLYRTGPEHVVNAWRHRDRSSGVRYRIRLPGGSREGTAAGLTEEGGLVLLLDDGVRVAVTSASAVAPLWRRDGGAA